MAPRLALGLALGVGLEPTPELPALGADLFPVEARIVHGLTSVVVQADPAQLALDAALSSRRCLGLLALVERRDPLGAATDLRWGLGLDGAVGAEARPEDGVLRRPLAGALAPAGRVGVAWSGRDDRFHPGIGVRGAIGLQSSADGAVPWARALVEATVVWGAR